ncbi:hypothetical protein BSM4216_1453 [Bacillus smithii]|nr:hypothetical protein BSM4216_1453 [Bacillus smithii]
MDKSPQKRVLKKIAKSPLSYFYNSRKKFCLQIYPRHLFNPSFLFSIA